MAHKKIKVLELFAGSRSIGNVADKMGMEVFSVDWEKYDKIDLAIDIGELTMQDIPWVPDMIWASPDCKTYSISKVSYHREDSIIPKSDYAIKCDAVNEHFISLIKEWEKINPDLVFFIENPRGMLRLMPFMQEFRRHSVWYCQYGDNRAKPTDLWTNSKIWLPKPVCRNYDYDDEGNIIRKHCHHDSAQRSTATGGTQGKVISYEKSKIPEALCIAVLESVKDKKIPPNSQLEMYF
tara:strand:+ start:16931 stop:17641 length:711 start_codon:yes stop_codon:yes gene_type:complete